MFLLLSLLPPTLALTTLGEELLGRYQIPVAAILYIPTFVLGVLCRKHFKRTFKQTLREQAICPKCYYDLTSNVSGVCPECGSKTDQPPVDWSNE